MLVLLERGCYGGGTLDEREGYMAIWSAWLYANDFRIGGTWSTITIVVPNRNVYAHMTVSTYVPVVNADQIGGTAIGTRIIAYSYFQSPNVVIPVDTPLDWNQNALYIDNCASVTFGLQCKEAWGYAVGIIEEY